MAANNAVATKAELISGMVQKELTESASLLGLITDLSPLATKGYDSISIPKMSQFTTQDRAFGQKAVENAPLVDSKDTLPLDKNKIVIWGYDDADAMQSSINWQIESAKRASTAHGRTINGDVVAGLIAGTGLNLASVVDITSDNILDMRKFLIQNFADMTNAVFLVAADQEKAMLLLPEFSRYDYNGKGAFIDGIIGHVYGVPVVINQYVPAGQAIMFEKSGFAFAFQKAPKYGEQPELDYGTDGKKAVVDCLYGVAPMQTGEGVKLDNVTPVDPARSPYIAVLS
tara:strand:+ start:3969 stop:4826 length:858 start_codon:yes stop_codon:yes gene_type:complete